MDFNELESKLEHITKTIQDNDPGENLIYNDLDAMLTIFNELSAMHTKINPALDIDEFWQAFKISAYVHNGQPRHSGEPFLAHASRTAYICDYLSKNNTITYTGQLHDAVEDSKNPHKIAFQIYNTLKRDVFLAVMGVSKLKKETDQYGRVKRFEDRYLANIETVKMADCMDNLHSVNYLPANNGKSAEQRQLAYCNTIRDNVLPMAERYDAKSRTDVYSYMNGLLQRNYERLANHIIINSRSTLHP